MKDFDAERQERHAQREAEMGDREFTLGGQTFHYIPIASYTVLEQIATTDDLEGAELIRVMENSAVKLIEEEERGRFLEVVRSEKDPLTFGDLNDVCRWLTEAQVGRPTQAPSPSMDGDAPTSITSTDDSSSKPAVASAA
jgi:hypothetical protein